MTEIEEDERESGAAPKSGATADQEAAEVGTTTTPPGSPIRPAKRKRELNPNADALRDVARFTLSDDPPEPGRGRRAKQPERWYYTKPRYVSFRSPTECSGPGADEQTWSTTLPGHDVRVLRDARLHHGNADIRRCYLQSH
jgi:hypothetical protein